MCPRSKEGLGRREVGSFYGIDLAGTHLNREEEQGWLGRYKSMEAVIFVFPLVDGNLCGLITVCT